MMAARHEMAKRQRDGSSRIFGRPGEGGLRPLLAGAIAAILMLGNPGPSLAGAKAGDAAAEPAKVPLVPGGCPRFAEGSQIQEPPFIPADPSGSLSVSFSFQADTDARERALYCFMTPDGMQNPTLHIAPGGTLTVTVTNNTLPGSDTMVLDWPCVGTDAQMTIASVNIHYHGTNTSPQCGSDQVIQIGINPGETYQYTLRFPTDEPPGLYWYHPHVHGLSDGYVRGGATGALIVDGIENFFSWLAGMPQQTIVLRDQNASAGQEGSGPCVNGIPFADVTVNNVPVNSYLASHGIVAFKPAALTVPPSQWQFWRVANTASDTILDLQLIYDGGVQTLHLVAIDGVPVNSQDGTKPGSVIPVERFRLPPASRVEFVALTPPASSVSAQLVTNSVDTGPNGDCDPTRPLLQIATTSAAGVQAATAGRPLPRRPLPAGAGRRFGGLATAPKAMTTRVVYFDEDGENFYMSVDPGPVRQLFNPNNPPGIITSQGAVETWIVQNRTLENHEFHIHQIHFWVDSQNFEPQAPGITGQYLDMIDVPAWSGTGPYPSATLVMDFRGAVVGSFVFHCHILNHEDGGMMNIIQVNPARQAAPPPRPPVAATPPKPHSHRH